MTSTGSTVDVYDCEPTQENATYCAGGTSAAAPIVVSVAALVWSYLYDQMPPPYSSAATVRDILERTAEDVLCDPVAGCDCPNQCVELLGWDMYTGYGRIDAGRALRLPIAKWHPLDLPHGHAIVIGETAHLAWEALDINGENGDLETAPARFELHCLVPELGLDDGWVLIDDNVSPSARSYDWVVPNYEPLEGPGRRIRITVVDSGGHPNQDYSELFFVVGSSADVGSPEATANLTIQGIAPNPTQVGARLRYRLGSREVARADVLDAAGRHIRRLLEGARAAGDNFVDWDGRDGSGRRVTSGVHFIRLNLGQHAKTVRLVLVQ